MTKKTTSRPGTSTTAIPTRTRLIPTVPLPLYRPGPPFVPRPSRLLPPAARVQLVLARLLPVPPLLVLLALRVLPRQALVRVPRGLIRMPLPPSQ